LREDHDEDKRRYAISLSELGQKEYLHLEPKVSALDFSLTHNLSKLEHDELQRLLKLVVR
jgi:DNA-binding MarR family transcriptional regulator